MPRPLREISGKAPENSVFEPEGPRRRLPLRTTASGFRPGGCRGVAKWTAAAGSIKRILKNKKLRMHHTRSTMIGAAAVSGYRHLQAGKVTDI